MPYKIEERKGEFIVRGPSGVKGKHKSRKKAEAQMRALYANMSPEERGMRQKGKGTREKI